VTHRPSLASALAAAALLAACADDAIAPPVVPHAVTSAESGSGSGGSGGGTTTTPTGTLTVVGVTVSPSIVGTGASGGYLVGGTSGTGTVTLSAAAPSATVVGLSSDNGFVMPVPPSVTVAAGQRSATFPVGPTHTVTGTFTLNVFAGVNGSSATGRVYVVPTATTDILTIPRLDLSPKRTSPPLGEVRMQATSTNPNAVLTAVWGGSVVATLRNEGGGRYSATFTLPTLDTDVEVRSNFGGCAVKATNRPTGSRSCPAL
jgi:hypothetical protein